MGRRNQRQSVRVDERDAGLGGVTETDMRCGLVSPMRRRTVSRIIHCIGEALKPSGCGVFEIMESSRNR